MILYHSAILLLLINGVNLVSSFGVELESDYNGDGLLDSILLEEHFIAINQERNAAIHFEFVKLNTEISIPWSELQRKHDIVNKNKGLKDKAAECTVSFNVTFLKYEENKGTVCLVQHSPGADTSFFTPNTSVKVGTADPTKLVNVLESAKPVGGYVIGEENSLVSGYLVNGAFYGSIRLFDKFRWHFIIFYIEPFQDLSMFDHELPPESPPGKASKRSALEKPPNAFLFEYTSHNAPPENDTDTTNKTTDILPENEGGDEDIKSNQTHPHHRTKKKGSSFHRAHGHMMVHSTPAPLGMAPSSSNSNTSKTTSTNTTSPATVGAAANQTAPNNATNNTQNNDGDSEQNSSGASPEIDGGPQMNASQQTDTGPQTNEGLLSNATSTAPTSSDATNTTSPRRSSLSSDSDYKQRHGHGTDIITSIKDSPTLVNLDKSINQQIPINQFVFINQRPKHRNQSQEEEDDDCDGDDCEEEKDVSISTKYPNGTTVDESITEVDNETKVSTQTIHESDALPNSIDSTASGRSQRMTAPKDSKQNAKVNTHKPVIFQKTTIKPRPSQKTTPETTSRTIDATTPRSTRQAIRPLSSPTNPPTAPTTPKAEKDVKGHARKRRSMIDIEEPNDIMQYVNFSTEASNSDVFDLRRQDAFFCELCIWIQPNFAHEFSLEGSLDIGISEVVEIIKFLSWIFRTQDFNMDTIPDPIGLVIQDIVVQDIDFPIENATSDPDHTSSFGEGNSITYSTAVGTIDPEVVLPILEQKLKPLFSGRCCVILAYVFHDIPTILSATSLRGLCSEHNVAMMTGYQYDGEIGQFDIYRATFHALAHLLGADHDKRYDVNCFDKKIYPYINPFVMEPDHQVNVGLRPNSMRLSYCSKFQIAVFLSSNSPSCLISRRESYCGNGIQDEGEECDCGAPWQCVLRDQCCGMRDSFAPCKIIKPVRNGKCNRPFDW